MDILRQIIYAVKRLIHKNPKLYSIAFSLITFNFDYLKQKLKQKHYPSKFGGMWTDSNNFDSLLKKKAKQFETQHNQPVDTKQIQQWNKLGYITLEKCIDPELIDQLVNDIENLPESHPNGLKVTGPGYIEPKLYTPSLIKAHESTRIVDFYYYNKTARQILFDKKITQFLELIFDDKPLLTQSLSFNYGSEQDMHQDTAFVIMNSPMKMVGVWIALEDVKVGSGELMYYPGSHLWGDFLFSGQFKHFDEERDGLDQLQRWYTWLDEQAIKHHTEKKYFLPKKGDVLIWHAGLAHGGAPITNQNQTRLSLVGHYCPQPVRPLYHYYKPAQRKLYQYQSHKYSSAYYK